MLEISIDIYDKAVVLNVNGELTIESVAAFNKIMEKQMEKNPGAIGINCAGIRHLDSYSISHVFNYALVCRARKIPLYAFNLNSFLLRVFEITNLSQFIEVIDPGLFGERFLSSGD